MKCGIVLDRHNLPVLHPLPAGRFATWAQDSLILSQDLGYGQGESLMSNLGETSKLLNAYARTILASGSISRRDIKGEALG